MTRENVSKMMDLRKRKVGLPVLILLPFYASFLLTPDRGLLFLDRSRFTGMDFRLENFPTSERHLIETMTGGCAFLDYDGDGLLDVFLVNGSATRVVEGKLRIDKSDPRYWNRLYRNMGGSRFQDVTEKAGVRGKGYGMGCAVGDYDNDGFPDLYVTNYGQNELYHNQGDGTFRDVTDAARVAGGNWSSSAAFFDYDRDGLLDLYVCRYVDWSPANDRFCGTPDKRDYCHPRHFKGVPDLLFKNNGNGTFTDVSSAMGIALSSGKGLGVAIGDFDRDSWLDVYVANDSVPCFLFHNKEGKILEEIGLNSATALNENGSTFAGMGVDFSDYNNDGWPDILATALSLEGFVLFQNNKDKTFTDVSHFTGVKTASFYLSGWGAKFLDFDNDGWKDLFVANGHTMPGVGESLRTLSYAQPLLMLKNRNGRFTDVTMELGATFNQRWPARGAAFGDYDNDGDTDILVTVLGNRPLLLENLVGSKNHWVGFQLIGTKSSRDAIGAMIKVRDSGGMEQHCMVSRTSSYLSSSDSRIVIGLGNRSVTGVEISWPSGNVQKIARVPSNRYMRIRESASGFDSHLPAQLR